MDKIPLAVSIPLAQQFKLSTEQCPKTDSERREMDKIPYASIVGSIMYTMVCTRPDLSHAISVASRFMSNPGIELWHMLKWILRYLRGTTDHGIVFGTAKTDQKQVLIGFVLIGFCDSDYAVSIDTRKSQSGYVFCLYGSVVSWKSSLQSVVALSTTEAEYIALAEAVKESFWLKGILADFRVEQEAVEIRCDSSSAICLSKHQTFHERSKHVDVRLHFIRDEVNKGLVKVAKVSTKENATDMLTGTKPETYTSRC
ncbi:secreted RxLR effector protein 161-like [Salvia splendens]|uniref:secreted RxLR effector protein 161-like n=1 Tax=Salvia splendens TaxID=180675 RepID=UPI001C27D48E|nr:secreted RxLR effector protein 161-like [Salvia splendens]